MLAIKTPEQRHWSRSGVFIVNFEHILHLVIVFLLLTLNMWLLAGLQQKKTSFGLSTRSDSTLYLFTHTSSTVAQHKKQNEILCAKHFPV